MTQPLANELTRSATARWTLVVLAVLATGAALACAVLWRSEVSANEDLSTSRVLERQQLRDVCGTVLSEFRWTAKAMTSGHEHGRPSRAAVVTRVRSTSQLLVSLASACAPNDMKDAPALNLGIAINDVETLDLESVSQQIAVWATWYVGALESRERSGWAPSEVP